MSSWLLVDWVPTSVAAGPPAVLATLSEGRPEPACRVVWPDLIRLDTHANLIVDRLRRAVL